MIRGTRLNADALVPRVRAQEIVANNLANVHTQGFRGERVAFHRVLAEATAGAEPEPVLSPRMDETRGALYPTGNPLDLAIDGPGYFVVRTPNGERYTRAGGFVLAADGRLSTPSGHAVVGGGGDIMLPAGDVEIDTDGTVRAGDAAIDRIRVVSIAAADLVREGAGLFSVRPDAIVGDAPAGALIQQGHLEGSNVESIREMVEMISIFREFETNHRAMTVQADTLRQLIEQQLR